MPKDKQISPNEPMNQTEYTPETVDIRKTRELDIIDLGPESDEVIEVDVDPDSIPVKRKTGPKPKELVPGIIYGKACGRNKVVIDPKQVLELVSYGLKPHELSALYGVNLDTLIYNFKSEIKRGKELGKIALRRAMMNNAIKHNNAAVQIFLAKNMLGMSDNPNRSDDKAPLPWVEDTSEETTDVNETKSDSE